jgi:hypothetical protein
MTKKRPFNQLMANANNNNDDDDNDNNNNTTTTSDRGRPLLTINTNPSRSNFRHHREKLAVTFDIDARREYLLGFSKRKRERRIEALKLLEKRAKEEKQEVRNEFKKKLKQEHHDVEMLNRTTARDLAKIDEENIKGIVSDGGINITTTKYDDEFTQNTFGDATVVVTTTTDMLPPTSASSTTLLQNQQLDDSNTIFVPKNTRFKMTKSEKIASRLRDKLGSGGKKKNGGKNKSFNNHRQSFSTMKTKHNNKGGHKGKKRK